MNPKIEPIYYNAMLGVWSAKFYQHNNGVCGIQRNHPIYPPITAVSYKESFNEERCLYCGEKGVVTERVKEKKNNGNFLEVIE